MHRPSVIQLKKREEAGYCNGMFLYIRYSRVKRYQGNGMNVSILNVTLLPKVLAGRHHLSLSEMAALRKTHFLFILAPLAVHAKRF